MKDRKKATDAPEKAGTAKAGREMALEESLKKRAEQLDAMIREKKAALHGAPAGRLRFNKRKSGYYYYRMTEPLDTTGTYIRAKDRGEAAALAQRDYDGEILRLAIEERGRIRRLLKRYRENCPEGLYERLAEGRRLLVRPIRLADDLYARLWQDQEYEGKAFAEGDPEHYTAKGERVRSRIEVIIADTLTRLNISYHYEKKLNLPGTGTIYPDFTVLNRRTRQEFLMEHLGMMDVEAYSESAVSRINRYIRAGYYPGEQLILTFETRTQPMQAPLVEQIARHYFL